MISAVRIYISMIMVLRSIGWSSSTVQINLVYKTLYSHTLMLFCALLMLCMKTYKTGKYYLCCSPFILQSFILRPLDYKTT